jgi:predicted CXXCH cytochrome family protein
VEERGLPFCSACHDDGFFERMADQGGSLLVSGHLDATTDYETMNIDPFSVQCMGCHYDEGEAPSSNVSLYEGGVVKHESLNHPVGVSYAKAVSFGGYRPLAELPEAISLPGGNVSCVSCHQGYSQEHGAMVIPMNESNLCFQCHDL